MGVIAEAGYITALVHFPTVIVASQIQSSSGTFALSFKDPSKSLALEKELVFTSAL